MKKLNDYFKLQKEIFNYFGYVEDWVSIPLDDCTEYYWYLEGEGPGNVHYADLEESLYHQKDNYYIDEIYTQRFLPKWVYRGEEYTMVVADPHCDGNKFLRIFDNSKERKPK